tara:strand:+ start:992 stop:1303 length:312 start_codon:yes stop_codon:yes gene_type:complete
MSLNWIQAALLSEMPDSGVLECVVDGQIVALFKTDDGYHAVDGICPHQGGSLGKGSLHGCIARCPWHGWEYDVRDGQHQSIPAVKITTYRVRVTENAIEVALS